MKVNCRRERLLNYRILEHKSDLAIWAKGKNLVDLFTNLAYGMYQAMIGKRIENCKLQISNCTRLVDGEPRRKLQNFSVEGETKEDLLVNFLNELIFFTDKNKLAIGALKIEKISSRALSAKISATPLFRPKLEIKAATYHDLKIKKVDNHFETTVLFDI